MANWLTANAESCVRTRALETLARWMTSDQKRIFLLCCRMLQDRDEADSVTQDVFLKAFKALEAGDIESLDEPGRWLSRVAVNACLDRLRSRRWQFWRRRPEPEDESAILALTRSAAPDAERQVMSDEIGRRLEAAVARLSFRQRAVFTLRHHEGRSLEEIAQLLGLETGTVKAHLARSLAKLREELRDLYQAGVAPGSNEE